MEFKILEKTPLWNCLSQLGKRIFLPEGIFYWSGRAKSEAELIGTIGSAFGFEKDFIENGSEAWEPCYLKTFMEYTSLDPRSVVPYAQIGGLKELRELWLDWIIKKSQYNQEDKKEFLKKYLTLPIVTQGITNGIFLSCTFFLNENEYIISPNKRWGNYDNIISRFLNAKIKSFEFFSGKKFNIDAFRKCFTEVTQGQNKIVLILNFPNNPTGYVPLKEEVTEIVTTLEDIQNDINKPIIVLVDDAYEPYVYSDKCANRSIFYELVELKNDIIPVKLDGISKELLAYGGRVGFLTIGLKPNWIRNDEELSKLKTEINNKLEGMIRSSISNTNHFYQSLTINLFKEKGMDKIVQEREKIKQLLAKRYKKINEEIEKINNPLISVDPNAGGFFLFINLDPNKIKAKDFGDFLLKRYKVGVIPIEKPADNINGIRIAYCSIDIKNIPEFVKRINDAINNF
ncbi:MAG: aminotransferase class I/II-fold pyridoxal phosphate-dependent enzyme [Promethearchaeia archaeon]